MAHTARSDDDKKEYFDPPDLLEKKVDQLVQWIKDSKHMIAFTGAGISTGAGIPDFRSGMNTSLSTGELIDADIRPGVWELRAQRALRDASHKTTQVTKAIPTPTHMMLVKLQQEGILKCCISQNTDGLHRRSGLPKSALCELHGNSNLEKCVKCKREYLRDFTVCMRVPGHYTGRTCDDPQCDGRLIDSIINFGENLPEDELTKSFNESEIADLCIAMGSSLTVTPAAHIPKHVGKRNQHLVIVNLQSTPLDGIASLRINAKCEDVSRMIMAKLGLPIPEFRLKRIIIIDAVHNQASGNDDTVLLSIQPQDMYGYPFTFIKSASVSVNGEVHKLKEPFTLLLPWKPSEDRMSCKINFEFQAHYGEPPITRDFNVFKDKENKASLLLSYNPFNKEWDIEDENVDEKMAALNIN